MQRFFRIYMKDHSWEVWLLCVLCGSCQLTPPKPAGARPRTPCWTAPHQVALKFVVRFPTAAGRVIRRELQATNPRTYFSVTYNDLTSFLAANSQEANHTVVVFAYNCPKIMKPFFRLKMNTWINTTMKLIFRLQMTMNWHDLLIFKHLNQI